MVMFCTPSALDLARKFGERVGDEGVGLLILTSGRMHWKDNLVRSVPKISSCDPNLPTPGKNWILKR